MKAETEELDEFAVTLDAYNSDLNLTIDTAGYHASPLTTEDFAFMWAGARATYGVTKGKVCFEVKVTEHLDISHLLEAEPNPHIVNVGFSVDSSSMQLGDEPLSYGYCGTGNILTNCQFKDFGSSFTEGDTILAVVNMDSDLVQIGFGKNGNFLGWAYEIENSSLLGKALYPHVLSKNCSFEVNFGQKEKPFFPLPDVVKDYIFIGCLPLEHRFHGTKPPATRKDCEIIMMCGLPGAGKSVWAAEYSSKHPEKKYNILGTNNIIDKMKVIDLRRWKNCSQRWDVLVQMATKCLNKLLEIGSKLERNYILDQRNVFSNAQKRKMRNFKGYKRIAVVVVPTEEEYKRRRNKRYRGKGRGIPDEVILEMKGYFKLPEKNDIFDDVIYTELPQKCAENLVLYYNEEGRAATKGIGPPQKESYPSGGDQGLDSKSGNFTSKKNNPSGRQHCDFGGHSRCGCNQDVCDGGKFHRNYGGGHGSSVTKVDDCSDYKGSRCDKTLGGHHGTVVVCGSYDRGNRNFDGRHSKYRRERDSYNDDRGSFERRGRRSYKDDRGGFDSRRSKYINKHGSYDDRIYSAFNRKKAVNEQSQNIKRMKACTGSDYHHTDKTSYGNYRSSNDFRFSSGNFGSNSSSCFGKAKENSKNDFSGRRGPGTDESKNLSGKFSDSNFEKETYDKELLNTGNQCDAFVKGLSHDKTRGDSHVYNSVSRSNANFHNYGSDSPLSFHGGNNKGERGVSNSYSGEYNNYPRCSEKKQNFFASDSDQSRQNTSSCALSSHESVTKEPIQGSDGNDFNSGSRSHVSGRCRRKTTRWSAEVATNCTQHGLRTVDDPVIQRTQPNWIPAENINRSTADVECSIKLEQ